MDELAAKQVLLDFEIIILIATAMGVFFYHLKAKWFPGNEMPGEYEFDHFDLILMWFPALLFLINPVAEVFLAGMEAEQEAEEPTGTLTTVFVNLSYFIFVGVMTYGIMEWVRNRRVVDWFGLKRLSLPHIVMATISGSVIAMVVCGWALGGVSQSFLEGIFGKLDQQEAVKMVQASGSVFYLSLSIITACIAAPLVEEFLFRGYIYGVLKQKTGTLFAMVVVGGIFAVVHGNLPALVPLWAFSILLCISYEITKSLWVPIGIHALFNVTNIVLMLTPGGVE
ncbi:CPBP family intramembrane glutamic endopeptidase [Verrucomicrobiales bacterium BCK34]|nr:CPBP family intramembrane glutamic endopeptidase [Verrucomicrobiales bacterium BCK34]